MNVIARTGTFLTSSLAGITFMVLAASPILANTHNQIVPNQASSSSNAAKLQQLLSQRTTPTNQNTQKTNQTGCACCASMMSNMPQMMNNMPGMMNRQHNMPGMMDRQNNQSK